MNFVATTLNFAWLVYYGKTLGVQTIVAPTVIFWSSFTMVSMVKLGGVPLEGTVYDLFQPLPKDIDQVPTLPVLLRNCVSQMFNAVIPVGPVSVSKLRLLSLLTTAPRYIIKRTYNLWRNWVTFNAVRLIKTVSVSGLQLLSLSTTAPHYNINRTYNLLWKGVIFNDVILVEPVSVSRLRLLSLFTTAQPYKINIYINIL